jgi:hypothetical protein
MHSERSDLLPVDAGEVEAVVMIVLLSKDHGVWTRVELEREVTGLRGIPDGVTGAIDHLDASGLVHLHGELVLPSWAGRRMGKLEL